MQIFVSTPFNLSVAFAHYGLENEYLLVEVYKTDARNRGRNYSVQNRILLDLAKDLGIKFEVVSVKEASSVLLSGISEIVMDYRVGEILPADESRFEIFKRLTLIVNGADFWQGFANPVELFKGRRRAKDYLLWKRTLKNYGPSNFLFPGASTNSRHQQIIPVSKVNLENFLSDVAFNLSIRYFPNFGIYRDSLIFIINPEVTFLNYEHIRRTRDSLLASIPPGVKSVKVIVKCHPSTINPEMYIDAYVSNFHSALTQEHIELNHLSEAVNLQVLSAFPIEFLLLAFKNSIFLGFPSTAISILEKSRYMLILSGNSKIDSTWKRTGRVFRGLI